jgi:hypothetical protein
LDEDAQKLFSYAARIVTCELRNARYESDSLRSAREHFLFEAVTEALISPEQFHDLMTRARIKDESPYLVFVVRDPHEKPEIPHAVRYQLENVSHAGFSISIQDDVVFMLLGRRARAFEGERRERLAQALEESGLVCGMSPAFDDVHELARRCREAKVTADLDEGLGLGIALLIRKLYNRVSLYRQKQMESLWGEDLTPIEIKIEVYGLGRYTGVHDEIPNITVPFDIFYAFAKKYEVTPEELARAYNKGVIDGLAERDEVLKMRRRRFERLFGTPEKLRMDAMEE